MNREFEIKFLTIKKWSNLIMFPVGMVVLIWSLFSHSGWMFLLGSLMLLLWLTIAIMWIVPTGNVGFIRNLGKLSPTSYGDGPRFRIPLISETFLLSVMVQTKDISDTKMVLSRNKIAIKATLTYQLEEKYAYIVFRMMGADYYTTHVAKWVDATFDTAVSKLTYPHFQALKADVEMWVSKLVAYELALKSSDMTEELVGELHLPTKFEVTACELVPAREQVPNPAKDPSNPAHALLPDFVDGDLIKDIIAVSETETEEVQRMELREELTLLPGVNLFKNVSIKLNEVKFEDAYEQARAQVAVRRAEVIETRLKAEKAREAARGIKDSDIIKAEGKAREVELIESAKNLKAKELGDFMKANPYMLKKILAENFPKVFGGANPVINLDEMLGIKPLV